MANEQVDFKEQMVEARRTQILLGAAEVFAEKGFHKATTKQIAQAAGVSEGTIYNYFDTKRDLLVAMIDLLAIQTLKTLITSDSPPDPYELLMSVMQDRYRVAQERAPMLAPLVAEVFADEELRRALYSRLIMPMSSHMERYIQNQIEAGRFHRLDPVIVTRVFIGGMMLNFAIKLTGLDVRYENVSAEALMEELAAFFLKGLLASDGQK
jgi:AcrR family transcriptional regulator